MFTFHALGFGFDEKRKDYKIVQILSNRSGFVAYVYSLGNGNNCWRKLDEPNVPSTFYRICNCRSYRDGTFYWGVLDDLIVSFDMSSEVFKTISMPQLPHQSIERFCKLKEGSMFIIMWSYECDETDDTPEFEIWALLDVGVTQSCTKLFGIDWDGGNEMPLGFWRNELLLRSHSNGGLLIIDPSKRETKEVRMDEPLDISSCFVLTKGKNAIPLN